MKILHLIDSLDYSGSARQLQLLSPALAQNADTVEICCLGRDTPWSNSLRQAGIEVHALGWTRWFDFSALWNLREIVRNGSFDVIHVWRLPALQALAVVAKDCLPRVVMSAPLPAKGKLAWWNRRLLQQVRCVAVAGVSDQERCVLEGIVQPPLRVVPPAILGAKLPTISSAYRSILCVGNLERDEGGRAAIWAFDFMHQRFADVQLQLVGAGSQLSALHALAVGLQSIAKVHFLGAHADVTDHLRDAAVVWIPSQANCGRQSALDAMAQGKAVVAFDVPCLREVIRDGETGYLVPVGDVVALARRTYMLLQDQRLRERIGTNAQQSVEQQFSLSDVVQRWRDVYHRAAA